jgi:acyl-CoA thioesterase I
MQHIFKSTGHALALFVVIWCGSYGFAKAQTTQLAQTTEIVGFGDSLMAGYELPEGDGFPAVLEVALKAQGLNVHVTNAGVSGDTTTDGLARLDWSVPDGTKLVILELGGNDALRGIAPEITGQNLDAMIASLKARNIKIVLAGMLSPPNMGKEYEAKFNAIYTDLAKKYALPLIPFFTEGVTGHPEVQIEDKLHPNRQGVDIMVKNALPFVLNALK